MAAYTAGTLLVGHQTGFDIDMLRSEMRRHNRDWKPTSGRDVMLPYSGLFPDRRALSLDAMAAELEVPVVDRHSALGDALTASEIFLRLSALLAGKGITTFRDVDALQRQAASYLAFGAAAIGQGFWP